MLTPNEIKQISEGTWELDCFKMRLSRNSSDDEIYEGPGYIKCTFDGQINFKLYSQNPLKPGQGLQWWSERSSKSGQLISDEYYFKLSAVDTKGRTWEADGILPEHSGYMRAENNVISGLISYELKHSNKTKFVLANATIGIKFFHALNRYIPCNTITKSGHAVGENDIKTNSWSVNVAKFSSCGCDFTINKEKNLTLAITSHDRKLPNKIEYRALETLQFVLAHPLNYTILEKNEEGVETVIIRRTPKETFKVKINEPVRHINPKDSHIWRLYDKYLSYILSFSEKTNWHPLSIFIHRVLMASIGYHETLALELAVGVEGILITELNQLCKPEKEFLSELDCAREITNESTLNETLKRRIIGAINSMKWTSPTDKLRFLVKMEVITKEEYLAWKHLRNSLTHPNKPYFAKLQKGLNLCDRVTTLFYKLIFYIIGYKGKYTDYSTYGYPLKDFSVNRDN